MINMHKRELSGQHSNSRRKIKHFSYSSEDKIGKGYSSVVYRGINQLTNETVAIKAIDMKGVKDTVSREMLDCQIQALTKLKHPNILKCYDVIRETSHCYIITEFCNEGDLSTFLKRKKKASVKEVLKIMKDIVSGFIEMAERNFLHRDLKLANIFISDGKAVIADFGFAKKHSNVFEKEKYNVGSPLYMSPQALKRNIYSIKNDIWSIGIMLFELLHGETPWECRTEKQLMEKMVRIPVKFRDSLGLPEQVKLFIKKCLEVNEDRRMSLSDLKEWDCLNGYKQLADGNMIFLNGSLELAKNVCSSKETPHILTQVTNRVSSRSQSNVGLNFKSGKEVPSRENSSFSNLQKQNRTISKASIEKNNNLLILEINAFRLLFKIYERLKKYSNEERELINTIGNEVIRRVTNLMGIICPDKENSFGNLKCEEFGLTDAKNYLNEEVNSNIKKYKAVVKQYHKKYTHQITISPLGRQISTRNLIRETLTKGKFVKENLEVDQMVMIYWMIEYSQLEKDTKKDYLDSVIDPKNQTFTRAYLLDRIKLL